MRAVLQRVTQAKVSIDGVAVGVIDRPGLVALIGVTHDDGPAQVEVMARKIADLRILGGERSVLDEGAPVLVVSQFTLYADTSKGRRPSWNARPLVRWPNPSWSRSWRRCGPKGSRWLPAGSAPTCRSN